MKLKLASFNLENIFGRAKALNQETWAEGKPVLDEFARLNKRLNKPVYTQFDKEKILEGLDELGVLRKDDGGRFVMLRQNRGNLLKRPRNKPVEVVANGRGDWIGWLELKTEQVNEIATRNTAQVVRDVNADIFCVIEVDDRIGLKRFNEQLLPAVGLDPYEHVMVIDGNDDRGIDVGLLTRAAFSIVSMRSHVDDVNDNNRTIFSRDCPEYHVELPGGGHLLVLVNHLKSKGFGSQTDSDARRLSQAARVRAIYDERRAAGISSVAVMGDFNDIPDSAPLAPLLANGSDLLDVSKHPKYIDDGRPGTFGNGTKSQKIDYILLSPELFGKVQSAGLFRKGVWGGKHGTLWEIYPEMDRPIHAASDHAAIWVELEI